MRAPALLFLLSVLAIPVGAGMSHAAPANLGIGLPADSLPSPMVALRAMFADSRVEPMRTAALAFHDSLRARGDTLGPPWVFSIEAMAESRWLHEFGRDSTLEDELHRVLARKQSLFGEVHPEVARSLVRLAHFHGQGWGRHALADSLLGRAEEVLSQYYGPEHPQTLRAIGQRAGNQFYAGDYVGAEARARFALERFESQQPVDSVLVASTSMLLGMIEGRLGNGDASLLCVLRSFAILSALYGEDHARLQNVHTHLGGAYGGVGNWHKALLHTEKSLALCREQMGADHPITRNRLSNYGIFLFMLGDDAAAREAMTRSLEGIAPGAEHDFYSSTYHWLGILELSQGRLAEAQATLERSLDLCRRGGPDHPDVATVLETLAITLGLRGRPNSALAVLAEARSIQKQRTADGHSTFFSTTLLVEAGILASMGRPEDAAASLHQALVELPDSMDVGDRGVWAVRMSLAKIDASRGRAQIAFDRALDLEGAVRRRLQAGIGELPERQAMRLAAVYEGGLELALSLLEQSVGLDKTSPQRALDEVIRSRALVLDGLAEERGRWFRRAGAPGGEAWHRWDAARRRWHAFRADPPPGLPPEQRERLGLRLRQEMETAEVQWRQGPARDQTQARANAEPGLAEVAQALPDRSALVSFVRVLRPDSLLFDVRRARSAAAHYMAFVLRAGRQIPDALALGDADSLDAIVREWHEAARNGGAEGQDGRRLRRALWDPLAPSLQGADHVYLVPDGAIALVSFAALPLEEPGYLIDQGPSLERIAAERDLLRPGAGAATAAGAILAVGGVDYDFAVRSGGAPAGEDRLAGAVDPPTYRGAVSDCRSFSSRRFDPLPASGRELRDVEQGSAALTTKAAVLALTGGQASELEFKRRAAGSRALHLATHGFVLDSDCPGGISGSASTNAMLLQGADALLVDNPLTRCGLALAGANRRAEAGPDDEDGLLTGDEIAALDLSGVEFVVLSACNTGLGDVLAGEGVLGLQRAFKMAGAGPVVMSLWPVEDQAARQWMREFYQARLTPGVSTAEATTRASKAILAERRRLGLSTRPSTWAAFVSVGVER